jgi:hypothetical protein
MPTFALIAEGKTDQIIVERIIEEVCEDLFSDEVDVNFLQPLRDASDAFSAPHAGWELVLEYSRVRSFEALATNDYVVIHLDTDCGDHPNFGVPLTVGGAARLYVDLVADASALIARHIGEPLYSENKDRLIFAIAVHSIESWLLLYLFDIDQPIASFSRLNKALNRRNRGPLVKDGRTYERIAREIKQKKLMKTATGSNSLSLFIKALQALEQPADEAAEAE